MAARLLSGRLARVADLTLARPHPGTATSLPSQVRDRTRQRLHPPGSWRHRWPGRSVGDASRPRVGLRRRAGGACRGSSTPSGDESCGASPVPSGPGPYSGVGLAATPTGTRRPAPNRTARAVGSPRGGGRPATWHEPRDPSETLLPLFFVSLTFYMQTYFFFFMSQHI